MLVVSTKLIDSRSVQNRKNLRRKMLQREITGLSLSLFSSSSGVTSVAPAVEGAVEGVGDGAAVGFGVALLLGFGFGFGFGAGAAFAFEEAPVDVDGLGPVVVVARLSDWSLPCSSFIMPRNMFPLMLSGGVPSRRSSTRCTTDGVGPMLT